MLPPRFYCLKLDEEIIVHSTGYHIFSSHGAVTAVSFLNINATGNIMVRIFAGYGMVLIIDMSTPGVPTNLTPSIHRRADPTN